MELYKYVLFDFDGTLADTNDIIVSGLRETAKKFLNRDLTADELNSILGKYLDEQMRCLSEEHCTNMARHYKEFYKSNQDHMVKEFPGIGEMLKEIRNLGCKTAIVSAKGRNGIEHGLELLKLQEYIDVIVSAYDVENNKPHPEPALKALEMLGGSCSEAILVGDSPYDILCGKNAGIATVFVDWTIMPKNEILMLNPDYHIKSPGELVSIVKYTINI